MIKKALLLLIIITSCKSSQVVMNNENPSQNQIPEPSKHDVIIESPTKKSMFTSSEEVAKIITYLASDELEGRDTGSAGIEKAADYISSYFESNGVAKYYDSYRDNFEVDGSPAFNVVGYVEGTDTLLKEELVIIGAHYDHIGKGKEINGDVIANGANDNAAGTSAVMEFSRYFSGKKTSKRSMLFVLFAAEEKGLLGSKHLAKRLKEENAKVHSMLNFEMIGVPLVGKSYTAYVTGFEKSNLAEKMNAYASASLVGYLPEAKKYSLFTRSDNYPFYKKFHIPAQTFCTFDFTNFDYYHHVDDEIDKLDFNHMSNFINAYIPAIEKVVNSEPNEIKLNE